MKYKVGDVLKITNPVMKGSYTKGRICKIIGVGRNSIYPYSVEYIDGLEKETETIFMAEEFKKLKPEEAMLELL